MLQLDLLRLKLLHRSPTVTKLALQAVSESKDLATLVEQERVLGTTRYLHEVLKL